MPKTNKKGEPKKGEMPSTLKRSSEAAQRTFAKAHDSAEDEYGNERQAHKVAYAALKHSFEKVGNKWVSKGGKRGPSDKAAEGGGPDNDRPSAEGVNANASKKHLMEVARDLDIHGRSSMNKKELVDAIVKENRRERRSGS